MPPADDKAEKQTAAGQAVDVVHEISNLLNCQLDRRTISICISMLENGVNPEALATVVKKLRREAAELRQRNATATPASGS